MVSAITVVPLGVENWRTEQVIKWMEGLDPAISPYMGAVEEEKINGQRLLGLTSQDLKERLGITKIGDQEMLLEYIEQLQAANTGVEGDTFQKIIVRVVVSLKELMGTLRRTNKDPNHLDCVLRTGRLIQGLKQMLLWCEKPPFSCSEEFVSLYEESLEFSISITHFFISVRRRSIDSMVNMMNNCLDRCEKLIQDSMESLILQPSSLENIRIKKDSSEELGLKISSSPSGIHLIKQIKARSPCHRSGKLEEGDELIQINNQTVVGWQLNHVVAALRSDPRTVLITVRKRPRHTPSNSSILYSISNSTSGGIYSGLAFPSCSSPGGSKIRLNSTTAAIPGGGTLGWTSAGGGGGTLGRTPAGGGGGTLGRTPAGGGGGTLGRTPAGGGGGTLGRTPAGGGGVTLGSTPAGGGGGTLGRKVISGVSSSRKGKVGPASPKESSLPLGIRKESSPSLEIRKESSPPLEIHKESSSPLEVHLNLMGIHGSGSLQVETCEPVGQTEEVREVEDTPSEQETDSTSDSGATQSDVTAQPDDVTAKSDDFTAQPDDVTAQSDVVTAKSDNVTAQLRDVIAQKDDAIAGNPDNTMAHDICKPVPSTSPIHSASTPTPSTPTIYLTPCTLWSDDSGEGEGHKESAVGVVKELLLQGSPTLHVLEDKSTPIHCVSTEEITTTFSVIKATPTPLVEAAAAVHSSPEHMVVTRPVGPPEPSALAAELMTESSNISVESVTERSDVAMVIENSDVAMVTEIDDVAMETESSDSEIEPDMVVVQITNSGV